MSVPTQKPARLNSLRVMVLALLLILTLSGLLLLIARESDNPVPRLIFLLHIWGGLLFMVVFPLYAWRHIYQHRLLLKNFSFVAISGLLQAGNGITLILSGLVLTLYYPQSHPLLLLFHQLPTGLILIALGIHYFSPKTPPSRF